MPRILLGKSDEVDPDENVCHASSGDVCHVLSGGGVPTPSSLITHEMELSSPIFGSFYALLLFLLFSIYTSYV